jgi:hypothetical protein
MPVGKYERHKGGLGESIKRKSTPDPETGCWVWKYKPQTSGYGTISVDYVLWLSHRLSYEVFVGPIPDGLQVLHRCDNRMCVNPSHLFVGTQADNLDDMYEKGRAPARDRRGVFRRRVEG